ncbi:DUF397 domain-containing protein [Streptomyces sp. NPDC003077]|uniref:DUF397 domain-containing protein n=1 Tax=Streptomyces sp. NPDC003077 TaxID=3154443 RepID=UPI0033BAB00D
MNWQKSSFSDQTAGNCVEMATDSSEALIRESDAPQTILRAGRPAIGAFFAGIKSNGLEDPA